MNVIKGRGYKSIVVVVVLHLLALFISLQCLLQVPLHLSLLEVEVIFVLLPSYFHVSSNEGSQPFVVLLPLNEGPARFYDGSLSIGDRLPVHHPLEFSFSGIH